MSVTDERIIEYKEAFFKVHKRYPIVEKRGAWIKIDDSWTSFRSGQLPGMTNILLDRYRKKQTRLEKIRIAAREAREAKKNKDKKNIKMPYVIPRNETWGQYVRQDSIVFFLNTLFEKCDHSLYQMQRWLDDFAFGDMPIIENKQAWDRYLNLQDKNEKLIEENEDLNFKVVHLEDEISDLKNKEKTLRLDYDAMRKHNIQIIKLLKEKIKHLKKNSVIFSMDDDIDFDISGKKGKKTTKSIF